MNEIKQTLWEDCLGDVGFRVRFDYIEYWCYVQVWEITGWERECDGGAPLFTSRPDYVPATTREVSEADRYLKGFIKWDGCSEFRFLPDEPEPFRGHHVHFCGPPSYRKHFELLEYLYRRAQSLMTESDYPWDDEAVQ